MVYCAGTNVSGPPHPILALGPQNVGMNQKGIGLRCSLHDKAEEGRQGGTEGGRSLGGRGGRRRENMATINWSSGRERWRERAHIKMNMPQVMSTPAIVGRFTLDINSAMPLPVESCLLLHSLWR